MKSPHGEVTGLLLPYVMEYNAAVETEKMVRISQAFNVNSDGLSEKEAALAASKAVLTLLGEIGLPTKLTEIGIKEEDIPEIAEKTLQIDRLIRNNPRMPTQHSLEELLRKAL
ncbi:Alcohol dehydrogenase 2 [Chlamydia trachomatis]|nr:Alcohol dehydrogenase 2 [Chlamydia trachomatis]